jgi:hypothetical protein
VHQLEQDEHECCSFAPRRDCFRVNAGAVCLHCLFANWHPLALGDTTTMVMVNLWAGKPKLKVPSMSLSLIPSIGIWQGNIVISPCPFGYLFPACHTLIHPYVFECALSVLVCGLNILKCAVSGMPPLILNHYSLKYLVNIVGCLQCE